MGYYLLFAALYICDLAFAWCVVLAILSVVEAYDDAEREDA